MVGNKFETNIGNANIESISGICERVEHVQNFEPCSISGVLQANLGIIH